MADVKTALYEGMFLINQQQMAGDLEGALSHIREMLDRAEAEVISLRKWDERKLAYPVNGQKRGLYVLALFRVRAVQIANIERDCNLSELVMRVLMTRCDHMGETEIELELKEAETSAVEAKLRQEQGDAPAEADSSDDDAEVTDEVETADA